MCFWPILYRIFVPFILLSVLMFVYGFKQLSKNKSRASPKKWKRMEKKRKTEVILSLSLCAVSFFYAVYLSSDLLFRDFITCEGVFQKYNRARYELVVWDVSFEIDGETSSFNLMNSVENIHSLVPGGTYKITYAKRTNMLLSISPYQP